jgi:cysteine desulfurase
MGSLHWRCSPDHWPAGLGGSTVKRIYLDNNATTPIRPEVREELLRALSILAGNPSSLHSEGRRARALLEEARERVAQCLDAEPEEVIFTSGGTEANNLAVYGLARALGRPVAVSAVEHPSVLEPCLRLEREGLKVSVLPVDSEGVLDLEALRCALRAGAGLVCVMAANNETGVLQPLEAVAELVDEYGAALHVDAVQAVGKVPVSFRRLRATSLSLSAHKFHGPVGAGALLLRAGTRLEPLLAGGPQERALRPGTESAGLAVALAVALELAMDALPLKAARVAALRDELERTVLQLWPGSWVNGQRAPRVPNTTNIGFPGLDAQALVMALDLEGVAASTGSACSSGSAVPSPVLQAMGRSEAEARASVRFSLSEFTSAGEIADAVERIRAVLSRMRPEEPVSQARGGAPRPTTAEVSGCAARG